MSTKDLVFKERPVKKLIEQYLYNGEGGITECDEFEATGLYENSSGSEC